MLRNFEHNICSSNRSLLLIKPAILLAMGILPTPHRKILDDILADVVSMFLLTCLTVARA